MGLGHFGEPTVPELMNNMSVTRRYSNEVAAATQILVHHFRVHHNVAIRAKESQQA